MELDLKDRSILFAVLIIDGVQVMSDEPFDRMFPMDNDAFRDYIESEMIMDDSVDVEYTYYSLGSGESDSADDNELDYIAEHLDKVIEDADVVECGTYSVYVRDYINDYDD